MNSYKYDIEQSFKKYYGALCYFATRYISAGGEVVEDLVQDCFVKLLERKVTFESEDYLRNYLYVAVRNNCFNYLQKNRLVERHNEQVLQDAGREEDAGEEIFNAEVVRCLVARIEELPPQCRQIIRMSYVEGLNNELVAERLNLSVNTVRAQKMRGKRLLKLSLGKAAL